MSNAKRFKNCDIIRQPLARWFHSPKSKIGEEERYFAYADKMHGTFGIWSGDFEVDRVRWTGGQITIYKLEHPLAERKEVLV